MRKLVLISLTSFVLFVLLSSIIIVLDADKLVADNVYYGVVNSILLALFFIPGMYLNIKLFKHAITLRDANSFYFACVFIVGSWIYYWNNNKKSKLAQSTME